MSKDAMVCMDIYLRHTDTKGHAFVQEHRVWNAQRFVESQQAVAERLNADVKGDGLRLASVQQITDDQFNTERNAR